MVLERLHHVTCVCADAQRTLDFYRDELGFSLVKTTVNFDDPHSYHLYFGDDAGSPGSLITFFEWPRAEAGRLGRGTLDSIELETAAVEPEQELTGSGKHSPCRPCLSRSERCWSATSPRSMKESPPLHCARSQALVADLVDALG